MRKLILGFAAAVLCGAIALPDAEARRLGGGRAAGAQRSITSAPPAQAPAKPMQQTQQMAPAPTAAQPAAAGGASRWMPMLGGLALGGMLGWLLGANGLGGLLVGMMLLALLVFGALFVFRLLAQRGAGAPPQLQYAGLGSETVAAPPPSQAAGFEPPPMSPPSSLPAGFDAARFLHGAKLNFMKLQVANDTGDLEALREFTTPELFEELQRDVTGRAGAPQHTDVASLNADLLEVTTEDERHWASVRFSGLVRESAGSAPVGFEEVWNLVKPVDGSSGWLLAGIQQMH